MPTIRVFPLAVRNGPEGADQVPLRRIPRLIGCHIVATTREWEPGATLVNTPAFWSRAGVDPVKPLVRKRLKRKAAGSSSVIRIHETRPADP